MQSVNNITLRFAIYERDLQLLCDWLDSECMTYRFFRKKIFVYVVVYLEGVLGAAGRAFDVGYFVRGLEYRMINLPKNEDGKPGSI